MAIRTPVAVALSVSLIASGIPLSAQTDQTWSRVRRLQPGHEIIYTVRSSPDARHRYFISADDAELVALNLTDVSLERGVMRQLLDFASRHPDAFSATRSADVIDGKMHVGSGGVVVSGKKVADLAQIVERTPRDDVVEVITNERHSSAGKIVVWVAIVVGGLIGLGAIACFSGGCGG